MRRKEKYEIVPRIWHMHLQFAASEKKLAHFQEETFFSALENSQRKF